LDMACGVGGAFIDVDVGMVGRMDADRWSELAGDAPC